MKRNELLKLIHEEIHNEFTTTNSLNEIYDLDSVKYSSTIKKQVDNLVAAIEKSPNLSKVAVASILNDIVLALGMNKTQMTLYMNMIKQQRKRYEF
jgi:hypothetical protein